MKPEISWNDFEKIDVRVGTVLKVDDFPEARQPALQLVIDFGEEIGCLKTSAQITKRYNKENLLGKQVIAVVNFPKKQIGKFMSECLVLGLVNDSISDDVVLLTPDIKFENGMRMA